MGFDHEKIFREDLRVFGGCLQSKKICQSYLGIGCKCIVQEIHSQPRHSRYPLRIYDFMLLFSGFGKGPIAIHWTPGFPPKIKDESRYSQGHGTPLMVSGIPHYSHTMGPISLVIRMGIVWARGPIIGDPWESHWKENNQQRERERERSFPTWKMEKNDGQIK